MADVALRDASAATTGRAHSRDELHVHDLVERQFLAVVPAFVVHPLAQDLNRWLGAICLLGRHVEVVHEDDALRVQRWAVHTLAAPVHLAVNDVLRLVGAGLSTER